MKLQCDIPVSFKTAHLVSPAPAEKPLSALEESVPAWDDNIREIERITVDDLSA